MGPLSQVLVSWCTISSSLMRCKPEIWETERGPNEYGRQPWCAVESSMLMLLARRSVHFAFCLFSLSALHNVRGGRAGGLRQQFTLKCRIFRRTKRVRNGFTMSARFDCSCHGVITDLRLLTDSFCVKVSPPESVGASIWPAFSSLVRSLTVHLLLLPRGASLRCSLVQLVLMLLMWI